MFVWRNNNGKKEFFVVHRKTGDFVVPTGHVEEGESLEEAAKRETQEEFAIEPITVVATGYKSEVILENNTKHSTEHAFLVEIPNQEVRYLERDETGDWHSLSEVSTLLAYVNQRNAIPYIEKMIEL